MRQVISIYPYAPFIFGTVAYYTKKRHGVANYLSTGEGNNGLAKEEKPKMSPFYVEGDRGEWQKILT